MLARAFEDAVAVDIAALATGDQAPVDVWPLAVADSVELVVLGAHLRGGPLVHQLTDLGGRGHDGAALPDVGVADRPRQAGHHAGVRR